MRVFQNCGLTPSYLARLDRLAPEGLSFQERRNTFLDDRFGALHLLQPVLAGDASAFLTCANDGRLQGRWAREHGVRLGATPEDILLARIEHHRTEVLYNLDPVAFPSSFVRRLPGCVRKTLCWRAAPSGKADLTAYGAVLGNFPSILDSWRDKGCRAEWFSPAIDPVMSEYVQDERPIDVLFVGGYSRHHSARARTLEKVAALAGSRKIVYCLDSSRLTRIAESSIGHLLPLQKYRRPRIVAAIAKPPVFGRELYGLIGRSKIVLNGAIDMAGQDRGNMRCFEAIGCGALLVSDAGSYPAGMQEGVTIETYGTPEQAVEVISRGLQDWPRSAEIAARGWTRVREIYSKDVQWKQF